MFVSNFTMGSNELEGKDGSKVAGANNRLLNRSVNCYSTKHVSAIARLIGKKWKILCHKVMVQCFEKKNCWPSMH